MTDDLQKVHNAVMVSPYFPVMIRPYPEEIDISHFSLSFTTHTQVKGSGSPPGPFAFLGAQGFPAADLADNLTDRRDARWDGNEKYNSSGYIPDNTI